MWSEKFMSRSGIKGYNILIRGDMKTPAGDTEKTSDKRVNALLEFLNKAEYNRLILPQKYTVSFQIVE